MSTGAPQGKHLSSEGSIIEILPVLSGSFIAGCFATGFFWHLLFYAPAREARYSWHNTTGLLTVRRTETRRTVAVGQWLYG